MVHKYELIPLQDSDGEFDDIEMDTLTSNNENGESAILLSRQHKHCLTPFLGYLLAFSSCLFFATGSMFVKLCSGKFNESQVILVRSFVQLFVCILTITHKRLSIWSDFCLESRLLLLLRGIFGGFGLTLIFYSFQHLPLGDASAIVFSSPIYVVLLARILLKERFGFLEVIILITNIIGVFLLAKPTFIFSTQNLHNTTSLLNQSHFLSTPDTLVEKGKEGQALYIGLAILASLVISGAAITIRMLPKVHFMIQIFYLSVACIIVASSKLIVTQVFTLPFEVKYYVYILLAGVCGICGQIGFTKAYQMESAGPVSIIRQSDIVFAYLYQVTVFHDSLEVLSGIGTIIIIAGSVMLGIKKWLKNKNLH